MAVVSFVVVVLEALVLVPSLDSVVVVESFVDVLGSVVVLVDLSSVVVVLVASDCVYTIETKIRIKTNKNFIFIINT